MARLPNCSMMYHTAIFEEKASKLFQNFVKTLQLRRGICCRTWHRMDKICPSHLASDCICGRLCHNRHNSVDPDAEQNLLGQEGHADHVSVDGQKPPMTSLTSTSRNTCWQTVIYILLRVLGRQSRAWRRHRSAQWNGSRRHPRDWQHGALSADALPSWKFQAHFSDQW